ncbi:MAG: hypothetical protein A3F78_01410 [Burkholderiales bacterium RIFCSPLOWO2_12_FULL_61_40]|nr:MAG: hypothetical protein A3F78_01410 [Burkholderiales bacterium RIFCSPLOWO2_12_FULL_61_40]
MKKIILATALAAALVSPQAYSQMRNFDGPSLGVNLNIANASNEFSVGGASFKNGDTSQTGNLQAAYGFAASDSIVLGVGLTYGPGDIKAGSVTTGGVGYELKAKDLYSLYFEPGFLVANSTLAYGKLSYQGMTGETRLSTGSTLSDSFVGTGYGAGIRTMLGSNLYLQAEFEQIGYSEKSNSGLTSKPTATMGSVGLGYRF